VATGRRRVAATPAPHTGDMSATAAFQRGPSSHVSGEKAFVSSEVDPSRRRPPTSTTVEPFSAAVASYIAAGSEADSVKVPSPRDTRHATLRDGNALPSNRSGKPPAMHTAKQPVVGLR
jgi:hypothetical protein